MSFMDINEYVYTRNGLFAAIVAPYERTLKDCSYRAIVTVIFYYNKWAWCHCDSDTKSHITH